MQIESFFQIKTSVANPKYMTNVLEKRQTRWYSFPFFSFFFLLSLNKTSVEQFFNKDTDTHLLNDKPSERSFKVHIYSMNKSPCRHPRVSKQEVNKRVKEKERKMLFDDLLSLVWISIYQSVERRSTLDKKKTTVSLIITRCLIEHEQQWTSAVSLPTPLTLFPCCHFTVMST